MRLRGFTGDALRLLMHLGERRARLTTIDEAAVQCGVPRYQLAKVVNSLGACGLIETVRGRGGGMRLARALWEIRLGELVRQTEADFRMAQCFAEGKGHCPLDADCRLRQSLARATQAYLDELDRTSLAQLLPCHRWPAP